MQPCCHRERRPRRTGHGPGQQAWPLCTTRIPSWSTTLPSAWRQSRTTTWPGVSIDRVAEYLADCAVTIANALDVELLIIGGKSVTYVAEIYKDKVTEFLRRVLWPAKTHILQVAISDMANEGAALGAASLVLHAAYAPNTADLVSVNNRGRYPGNCRALALQRPFRGSQHSPLVGGRAQLRLGGREALPWSGRGWRRSPGCLSTGG